MEIEKDSRDKQSEEKFAALMQENNELREKANKFTRELSQAKKKESKLVEDYEAKIAAITDDKKARMKEHVENLQTLLKEMTCIL
jgi:hypothetical protein